MNAFQPTMDAFEWGAFQIGIRDELAPALGQTVCDNIGAPGMLLLDVEWGAHARGGVRRLAVRLSAV